MTKKQSKLKTYLISSLITFISGFAVVLLSNINNITLQSITDGTALGIVFAALRAGVKALLEWYLAQKV